MILDENERKTQARTFLDALAGTPDSRHTFLALGPDIRRELHGTLEVVWPELCWLSGSGADIYVTVQETDGRGRKRDNIRRVRALYREDDGAGANIPLPVPPNITVSTSAGHRHDYWLTDLAELERFRPVELRLVADYGSDPGATDLARVLRLPGFHNRKPGRDNWMVTLEHCNGARYAWEALEQAFPPIARPGPAGGPTGPVAPPTDAQLAELECALGHVPADARETWITVGHALKTWGEACRALWEAWSATSPKWDPTDADYRWDTLRPEHTHWEAVYAIAAQHGWQRVRVDDFDDEAAPGTREAPEGEHTRPGGRATRGPDGRVVLACRARDAIDVEAVLEPGGWEPRWLVEGWLPDEFCAVIGAGGVGKTTVLLWRAVLLALGRPVYGCEVARPLRQVYVTYEDCRELLEYRLRRVMEAMDLPWTERRLVLERIWVVDASEVYAPWVTRDPQSGAYYSTQHVRDLVAEYRGWADLSYVDPLVQAGAGDENDNRAMNALVVACRQVRAGLGGPCFGVHHTGKSGARDEIIDPYSGRGGSALGDGARHVTVLVAHAEEKEGKWVPPGAVPRQAIEKGLVLREHMTKLSWGERWRQPVWLVRDGYAWTWHRGLEVEEVETVRQERDAARQREQLEALVDHIAHEAAQGKLGSAREWRDSPSLRLRVGVGDRRLRVLLELAVEQGRLEVHKRPPPGGAGRPVEVLTPAER